MDSQHPPASAPAHHELKGSLIMLLACAFFGATAVSVKLIAAEVDIWLVSWVRFGLGTVLALILMRPDKNGLKIQDPKAWLMRGIFGAFGMLLTYIAIQMTSSGRATLLSDTYPIFVALIGYVFFKEFLSWHTLAALALCLLGAGYVFYDQSQYPMLGNVLGLAAGVCGGFAVHYIKAAGKRNSVYSVYLSACLFGLVLTSFGVHIPKTIRWMEVFGLLCIGVLAFVGQVLMTHAYRFLPANRGSIVGLAEIPLTIFASTFIGEVMTPRFILGSLVILAGLVLNQTHTLFRVRGVSSGQDSRFGS